MAHPGNLRPLRGTGLASHSFEGVASSRPAFGLILISCLQSLRYRVILKITVYFLPLFSVFGFVADVE